MFSALWDISWDTETTPDAEAARRQARNRDRPPPPGGTPEAILRDDLARHPTGLPAQHRRRLLVRTLHRQGADWIKKIALADDLEPADGKHVLTYWQAIDMARALARRQPGADDANRPVTVSEALDRYQRDLESRGADAQNANRVRRHLTPTLATKPVALLTMNDLRHWRDGLVSKGVAPATINRTRAGLRAALELAASLDDRITNRNAFRSGLKGLPGGKNARRVVLPDADVLRLVEAAYQAGSRLRRAGRGTRADRRARLAGRAAALRRFAS